jgi:hypothetical protein
MFQRLGNIAVGFTKTVIILLGMTDKPRFENFLLPRDLGTSRGAPNELALTPAFPSSRWRRLEEGYLWFLDRAGETLASDFPFSHVSDSLEHGEAERLGTSQFP